MGSAGRFPQKPIAYAPNSKQQFATRWLVAAVAATNFFQDPPSALEGGEQGDALPFSCWPLHSKFFFLVCEAFRCQTDGDERCGTNRSWIGADMSCHNAIFFNQWCPTPMSEVQPDHTFLWLLRFAFVLHICMIASSAHSSIPTWVFFWLLFSQSPQKAEIFKLTLF